MRNTHKLLFSGALISALAFTSVAYAEGEQATDPAQTQENPIQSAPQTQGNPGQPAPEQTPANPAQPVPQTPDQQNQQDPTQGAPESAMPQDPTQTRPQAETPPDAAQAPKEPYEVPEFFSDSRRYTIGDTVPEKYRSKTYEITEWQKRHLPAPEADSHWTYMGGNYVLITKGEGKIVKAKSGDIFFH